MKIKNTILFLLCFGLYNYAPAFNDLDFSQENITREQERLEHEVSVALKLVQVYVTDKTGKPVGDLAKEDFVLYDNGQLMTITEFERHSLSVKQGGPEESDKEAGILKAPMEPVQINRKFFLLIDANRNDGLGLIKAKRTALHFINTQILSTDELGLLSYSTNTGLMLHEYLTNDQQRIRDLIDNIKLFPGMSPRSLEMTARDSAAFLSQLEPVSELEMKNALDFTSSLSDFAASLRYIPGYKNILLFSSGIARTILEGEDPRFRFEFERMIKEITSSNSSVYTIDTQGQRDLIENREEKGDLTLRRMADVSGGRHFVNVDRRETIAEEIQMATGNYYVLGYYVNEKWDGSFHEIKVEVKQEDYRIQAQKGYYNPQPFSKFTKLEKELHLKDIAFKDNPYFQIPLSAPVYCLPQMEEFQSSLLCVTVLSQKVVWEVFEEEAEIFSYVLDEKGDIILEGRKEVDLTKSLDKKICFYTLAELDPGVYQTRVIIRNKKSGRAVRAISKAVLPERTATEFKVFPPLILTPDKETIYLRSSFETGDRDGESQAVKMNSFYSAVLTNHFPITGVLARGEKQVKVLASYSYENSESPDISLNLYLIHRADGDRTQLSPTLISSVSMGNICLELLELVLPELDYGEYTLEVVAADPDTGENVSAYVTFQVE